MPSDLLLLAFDTSAAHCAAALLSGDRILAQRHDAMARGQAEHLMPMLAGLLAEAGTDWGALDLVAVGIGPGNFTGIRISVAAARGLALGLARPAIGVSRFELAIGAAPPAGPLVVSVAAPRDTFYLQGFARGWATGAPVQFDPAGTDLPRDFPPGAAVLGADAGRVADLLDLPVAPMAAPDDAPAATLGRIALARWRDGETRPARPAPLYVRRPDAAPARDAPPVLLD